MKEVKGQQTSVQSIAKQSKTTVFEQVWKYSFVVISIVFAVLLDRTYKYRKEVPPEQLKGNAYNILFSLPLLAIFHTIKRFIYSKLGASIAARLCDKRFPSAQKREERSHLLSKWVFDVFYYSATTAVGVWIMKDLESFPDILNGGLRCPNILNRDIPASHEMALEWFYILQFSNHLQSLVSHVLSSNVYGSSKFYEYCLHHGMAVFLIYYSYMLNFWLIGSMVLIFHDASDAFLIIGRFYLDLKDKNNAVLSMVYVISFVVWVACRLIMFPACCLVPAFEGTHPLEVMFLFFMLGCLLVMHLYWTYFFVNSATFSKRKGGY